MNLILVSQINTVLRQKHIKTGEGLTDILGIQLKYSCEKCHKHLVFISMAVQY